MDSNLIRGVGLLKGAPLVEPLAIEPLRGLDALCHIFRRDRDQH